MFFANSDRPATRNALFQGLDRKANYTFSKALTDANAFRSLDPQIDNASPTVERARADYDLTHTFKFNHYIPLPIGAGHRFASKNPVLARVLDGWSVSGLGVIQTGSPISILSAHSAADSGGRKADRNHYTRPNAGVFCLARISSVLPARSHAESPTISARMRFLA